MSCCWPPRFCCSRPNAEEMSLALASPARQWSGMALVLSQTRSIWIAAVVAGFICSGNGISGLRWRCRSCWCLGFLVAARRCTGAGAIHSASADADRFERASHRLLAHRLADDQGPSRRGRRTRRDRKPERLRFLCAGRYPLAVARRLVRASAQYLYSLRRRTRHSGGAVSDRRAAAGALWISAGLCAVCRAGRSDRRFLLQAAIACVIGTMVSGVFEMNLGDTEVLTMFLAIVCLGYLAADTRITQEIRHPDILSFRNPQSGVSNKMLSATQLRPGMVIKFNNELYSVFSVNHRTPGQSARLRAGQNAQPAQRLHDGAPLLFRRQSGEGHSRRA